MSLFIAEALAENGGGGAGQTNPIMGLLPLIVIFVIFYFLLIRPQQKRAKEHRGMVANLAEGDEVVTSGGLLGRIVELDEQFLTVEVADGIKVRIQRHAVASLMPKGTIKGK